MIWPILYDLDAKHQLNNLNSIKRECNAIIKYIQKPEENVMYTCIAIYLKLI